MTLMLAPTMGLSFTPNLIVRNEDQTEIVSNIGIQPSDVLLSNGIVFVEGVSDRMYLRRWISLYCQEAGTPEPLEGVHYTFLGYGGRCLSHFSFEKIDYDELKSEDIAALIPVLSITHKYYVVMDRDRESLELTLSDSKCKVIHDTNEKVDCGVWVTDGREIENYLPELVHIIEGVGLYSSLPRLFVQKFNKRIDKREYAEQACHRLNSDNWAQKAGLRQHIGELIQHIKSWNE